MWLEFSLELPDYWISLIELDIFSKVALTTSNFSRKKIFYLNWNKQEIPEITVRLSSYRNHYSDDWKWENHQNWNSQSIFYRWKTKLATCHLHQMSLRRQLHRTKSCQGTLPTLLVNSSGWCSSHLLWNCLNVEISEDKSGFFRKIPWRAQFSANLEISWTLVYPIGTWGS